MNFACKPRALTARPVSLTTGLVVAVFVCALLPNPTAASSPVAATPTSVTSFPSPDAPSGLTADQAVQGSRTQTAASSTLGVPVAASLELSAGTRIGYLLNSTGKRTASRSVLLEAPEAASATRRYRRNGNTYYLLSWGPLAGHWVRKAAGSRLIRATAWKVLVMVYRQTNLEFVDASGQRRHLGATMSAATEKLMVGAVKSMPKLTRQWSSGVVAQQMTVVRPGTPLSRLTALGGGAYWLAPEDIAADIAVYAPASSYDSIMVIWQPWDAEDYVSSWGWGLAFPAGPASNGSAYSTVTVPPRGNSSWISGKPHQGEPFMHEWLHGVIDHHASNGSDTPDLHADARYGYVEQDGTWSRWYGDLMKQHVPDPLNGAHVGISYIDWRSGTITSR